MIWQGKNVYIRIYILKWQHKYIYIDIYVYVYLYIYIYMSISICVICCNFKRKTKAQAIFSNLFTVCSSGKQKFVICLFVYEETNGSYPFAIGLN
jgi:hypothetical protein